LSTTRFPPPNPADDDYIRRGDLLSTKNLFYAPHDRALKTGPFAPGDWAISVETVYSVPAADVRPVVLCRDCEHEGLLSCPIVVIEKQQMVFINHDPEFFCASGERKNANV
jgi:hypothetical protein